MRAERREPIHAKSMKPGAGWEYLSGAVWAHESGVRIHTYGTIQMPNKGEHLSLHNIKTGSLGWRFIAINGGNRARGLMAWALHEARQRGEIQ